MRVMVMWLVTVRPMPVPAPQFPKVMTYVAVWPRAFIFTRDVHSGRIMLILSFLK